MHDWLGTLAAWLEQGPVTRIAVSSIRGSTPREVGACMLVAADRIEGTIGGGHLEWTAIEIARGLLDAGPPARLDRFPLGATLGQCCGGAVELWFERYDAADRAFVAKALRTRAASPDAALVTHLDATSPLRELTDSSAPRAGCLVESLRDPRLPLVLYGAGHVGRALAPMLAALDFRITWIDAREDAFPPVVPAGVEARWSDAPDLDANDAEPGAVHVVMTHDHALDYAIVRSILHRNDFRWLGMIGSETKALRFRQRLAHEGFDAPRIARLVCPLGIDGISSKQPAAIAVSVAAQLQGWTEARAHQTVLAAPTDRSADAA